MAAYFIVDVDVTDQDTYQTYATQVPPIIKQYGGRYLVRGGKTEVVEGDWRPSRLVVLQFDDTAAARRFYDSKEYQAITAFRQRAARTRMVLVEGYEEPHWEPPV
ncbi:MAG: DUF1330 domain-containing protein [Geminicoccaceae bacterium]